MRESQHTEWKESWRDDHLRWVCGFANAGGGTLQELKGGESNELRLTFRFSSAYLDNIRGSEGQSTEQGKKWGERWGEKWGEKTAATRLRIAQAMRRNPRVTIVELAVELGVASTSGIEKHLKAMREAGCIRRVGPAKGGRWEVLP